MAETLWYLKGCDLFERLTPEQIARLEQCSRVRTFERNSLVYLPSDQSDSVLLLASGRIKIYHITAEGKQALLALIDPGELFGELALVERGPRDEFAEAMERSSVVMIPGAEVRALMQEHAELALGVTKLMGLRRKRIERRLKSLLFRSNRERLIHLLLELIEKYGRQTPDGVLCGIRLSHQELASVIGSTRETVTVLLGELQAEGLLAVSRRRIVVRQPDRLAAMIDEPPPTLPVPPSVSNQALRRARYGS